jgi:hypothetical protein
MRSSVTADSAKGRRESPVHRRSIVARHLKAFLKPELALPGHHGEIVI